MALVAGHLISRYLKMKTKLTNAERILKKNAMRRKAYYMKLWGLDEKSLKFENEELKKLLKESIEKFPTKELADRIYSVPGIERPPLKPIAKEIGKEDDEEIPY